MRLSKTEFIHYLNCPKSFWLLLKAPNEYPHGEFSVFLQKLTREGYEVEQYVRQFFEHAQERSADFQRVFETEDGLFARADAIEAINGGTVLYEIKSSTSVKVDAAHNHLKDACFQVICAERTGQKIDAVSLVHLNGNYVRDGEIVPEEMLVFEDVTERVRAIEAETKAEIGEALALLREVELDRSGCSCIHKSRSNHCDAFALFNPAIPKPSIYSIPRLSAKKRAQLIASGILDLLAIPDDYTLSANQAGLVQATKSGAPIVNPDGIRAFLAQLSFPLYFLDYETFASAAPVLDRTSPHKHFPVQYSLHVLNADGSLNHHEYLERELRLPDRLVGRLGADIGDEGSVISWHASFEKTQNKEMARLFPDFSDFLAGLNDRMADLEDVFKTDYVDARFDGSTSIKKVLPVVCPELSYKGLDVQDGASAMDAWQKMVTTQGEESDKIATALLGYCKLDTFAMVEIYRFLVRLTASTSFQS